MATPKVYAICDANCRWETMTKEQIIAAIAEATGVTVTNVDEAFITMLKEQNNGESVRFWVGTQAEYNTLVNAGLVENGVIYLTEDGSKLSKLEDAVQANAIRIKEHENRIEEQGATLDNHENRIKAVENASPTIPSHTHNASAITSGTLSKDRLPVISVAKGGTGATTAAAAREKLGIYYKRLSARIKDKKATFDLGVKATCCTATLSALYEMNITEGYVNDFLPEYGRYISVTANAHDTGNTNTVVYVENTHSEITFNDALVSVDVIYIV